MMRWLLGLGLLMGMCGPAVAQDGPNDPAALLERLRQRDAQLDNRSIEVEQRWTERVRPRAQVADRRFHARRFGQPDPGVPPEADIPADFDQPHRLRRLLTAREPELTIERLGDLEAMVHPEYVALPNRGARWSSVGGEERVWSPETGDLHVLGPPAPDGLLRWDAHRIRWSCGYGLARWIRSIEAVTVEDGKVVARGQIRLLGDADGPFEARFDGDLILRRAVIAVPARDGGSNEYEVETRGTVRPGGCPPVAASGRVRRTLRPAGGPPSVYQDDAFHFIAASAFLSDAEYRERTRIEPPAGVVPIRGR